MCERERERERDRENYREIYRDILPTNNRVFQKTKLKVGKLNVSSSQHFIVSPNLTNGSFTPPCLTHREDVKRYREFLIFFL